MIQNMIARIILSDTGLESEFPCSFNMMTSQSNDMVTITHTGMISSNKLFGLNFNKVYYDVITISGLLTSTFPASEL